MKIDDHTSSKLFTLFPSSFFRTKGALECREVEKKGPQTEIVSTADLLSSVKPETCELGFAFFHHAAVVLCDFR